jgi:ribose transport system permease protein
MVGSPVSSAPPLRVHAARDRLLDLLRHHGREIGMPLVVVLLIAFFAVNSDVFFTVENFRNVGVAGAALAAVAFGQTFTILTGGMDLSVGSTVALVSVVGAFAMRDYGIAAGLLASLACGLAVGLVNGLVVTRLKVFPFICTLATMSIANGLALQLAGGVPVPGLPEEFGDLAYELIAGIPVPVVVALVVLIVAWLVLDYTRSAATNRQPACPASTSTS